MPDHYTLLGVARSATTAEIKAAYRRLVAQYHPDLNPDPQASDITATLNEAFAVLSDEEKRKAYDEEFDSNELRPSVRAAAGWKSTSESSLRTRCQNCGRQDSSLRYSQFSYTVSFLVVSSSRNVAGVWCERCRVAQSAKWSLLSGFAGWWGIPFGPFRTIRDLVLNGRGGGKPAPRNAALLRSLGYDLYGRANYEEAARALQQSVRFEPNLEANAVLDQLQSRIQPTPPRSRASSLWSLASAAPTLAIALIWVCIIDAAISGVGAYRVSHQSPQALAIQSSMPRASVQQTVSLKINRLAALIASRSSRVGFHHEGSILVTDYGLDRSRYDAWQLYAIAESIGLECKGGTPDPQGFLARAYFNSMLFALSVDIVNRIYQGLTIETPAQQAEALGKDPRVSAWLHGSSYWPAYQALQTNLQVDAQSYKPAQSLEEMETRAERIQSGLQQMEFQQRLFQAEQNIPAYNRLVPAYNRDLARLKALSNQIQDQLVMANRLDAAFNRCLDGSILLGTVERVDLTSDSSQIDPSP